MVLPDVTSDQLLSEGSWTTFEDEARRGSVSLTSALGGLTLGALD
eukprot:CAMPEP_0197624750 /NCGR_PEP_ID=MMETSP1338-20131121/4291_1 /TAXON_ID=43686 ORGANISM="Pelagodinium beii, Strain RCC1491" /NCGR_SAMPLE_ID=MMETSP1338 /ASSEMBLY_ACC=CAM_ASM_000754 /LENGTH=44 /DNA_ID= /DNA_START= /DNA_END= /DNA_ORIENTATION=